MTRHDIQHAAALAHLRLSTKEEETLSPQLTRVVGYISELSATPTDGVEETSQVTGRSNVFREDVVDPSRSLSQDAVLANAPDAYNGFVKVKAILDGES